MKILTNSMKDKTILLMAILGLTFGVAACSNDDSDSGSSGGGDKEEVAGEQDPDNTKDPTVTDDTDTDDTPTTVVTPDGDIPTDVEASRPKVRNFTQFYNTYAVILDLSPEDTTYSGYFDGVKTNLPTNSEINGFLGSHQLGLVKFGSSSCDYAYTSKSVEERQKIFGVDTSSNLPLEVFGPVSKRDMITHMMKRFWGWDDQKIADNEDDMLLLEQMVNESISELNAFNPGATDAEVVRYGVGAACTAMLTSAPVSFYGF